MKGTHQDLVYVDGVNILGGSVNTTNRKAEAWVAASKKIGLEVNADNTKYMVMSRGKSAGWSHNIKTDNSTSFEIMDQFKYLEHT